MADIGYIKLYRRIWENDFLADGERFTRMSAWLWLLTHANYKDGTFMKNGRLQHIQRGQMFTSIRYLSAIWGWDRKTVARYLGIMETEKMITVTGTQNGTLITIRNYSKYQDPDDSEISEGATEWATDWTTDSTTHASAEGTTTKEEYKKNTKKKNKETAGGQVIE